MMWTFAAARRVTLAGLVSVAAIVFAQSAAAQDAALIKKGQDIYTAQKCQLCHSVAGKGSKVSALDGVGKRLSADDIKQWITHPTDMAAKAKSTKKPPMQNKYATLPAGDLDALVAYMASLK